MPKTPFIASYKKYTLLFKKPAGTSRGYLQSKTVYFIRLTHPNTGQMALGECAPWPGLSLDDRPDFEAKLAQVCARLNQGYKPSSINLSDFPALAFGLETAWKDWQTGGQQRLYNTPFSRGEKGIPLHGLIWMASRAEMMAQVRTKVSQGHQCIKMKVGALAFEEECGLLADIRAEYPAKQIELRLDANGAFLAEEALEKLNKLAQFQIHSIEQPLKPGQTQALAQLCAQSPIPIALDEELIGLRTAAEKINLLATVKPRYLVLKSALIGGLAAAEEWIALARGQNIGWWLNSALESNVGLNALAQWLGSQQTTLAQGLGTGKLYSNNIPAPLKVERGHLIYDTEKKWNLEDINN